MKGRRREGGEGGGIRAFVALELDASMRERIAETMADLRRRIPGVRWVSTDGLHLTLRFLGHAPPHVLAGLEPDLQRAAAACPPGEARVAGLGMFPERGSPRVLWLAISLPSPGLDLQGACEAAAVRAGFPREDRAFRPHLTLGRWRDRAPRPELPSVDLGMTALERLVLFRSELRPQGAVYTPLATFPLG